ERFAEVLAVASDMRVAAGHGLAADELRAEWMKSVGTGVPGYVTPKVAVGAVVGNDRGEILLVQRGDSGAWLSPTGRPDVGYERWGTQAFAAIRGEAVPVQYDLPRSPVWRGAEEH